MDKRRVVKIALMMCLMYVAMSLIVMEMKEQSRILIASMTEDEMNNILNKAISDELREEFNEKYDCVISYPENDKRYQDGKNNCARWDMTKTKEVSEL